MGHKLARALDSPQYIYPYVRLVTRSSAKMLRQGNYWEFLGYLLEEATGEDHYFRQLDRYCEGGLVEWSFEDGEMLLDAGDSGISRRLLRYNVHEESSSAAYRRELRRIRADVDGDVGVLELGANLGYFLLIAASVLDDRAQICAVEPHPRNLDILRRNVKRNGYADQTEIVSAAVGRERSTATLQVMSQSNWHTLNAEFIGKGDLVGTLDVDVVSVDSLLAKRGLEPEDVNVVRFDVDGHEHRIFEGMRSVLEADSPLLLYIELHPDRLDDETFEEVLTTLNGCDLRIVSSVEHDLIEWDGRPVEFDSFDDLRRYRDTGGVEIIARR